jgi:hypothetical protein
MPALEGQAKQPTEPDYGHPIDSDVISPLIKSLQLRVVPMQIEAVKVMRSKDPAVALADSIGNTRVEILDRQGIHAGSQHGVGAHLAYPSEPAADDVIALARGE